MCVYVFIFISVIIHYHTLFAAFDFFVGSRTYFLNIGYPAFTASGDNLTK